MTFRPRTPSSVGGRFAILAVAALAAPPDARALDRDRVLLRASASAAYNSNVFLISDEISPAGVNLLTGGEGESDMIWGIGGGIGLNLPVSRQRFRIDASATQYYYQKFDDLDYTGYQARGTWDWQAGNRWHGKAAVGAQQSRQAYTGSVVAAVPRLQRYYDGLFDARYDLTTRWQLQGAVTASQTNYVSDVLQFDDFNQQSVSFGAVYRTPQGNSTGARLRYEQGKWPDRPPAPIASFDNEYSQYTLSGLLDWRVSGQSRVFGDLGYTFRFQNVTTGESFNGPSGRLTYEYSFTGKSIASASIYQTLGPYQDNNATYIRTTGLDLTYFYQVTSKVAARATASFYHQDYLGASLVPGIQERKDEFTVLGLSGTWQATRTVSVIAGASYNARSSNIRFGDYDQYILSLTGNLQF